jgi:lipoprotein-anchoring transpeptidase ErfK/SrfK
MATNLLRSTISRRRFLSVAALSGASFALSACATTGPDYLGAVEPQGEPREAALEDYAAMYAPVVDEGHQIAGVPTDQMEQRFLRQIVDDPTGEAPGTILVDTSQYYLYLIQPGGRALRYGVGLGPESFEWSGRGVIQSTQKWPASPAETVARDPSAEIYSVAYTGMAQGVDNALGARALYISKNGKGTLYHLHGTPEWASIGKSVSSGCVRLMNQDIIDLYSRVSEGSPIMVTRIPRLG